MNRIHPIPHIPNIKRATKCAHQSQITAEVKISLGEAVKIHERIENLIKKDKKGKMK